SSTVPQSVPISTTTLLIHISCFFFQAEDGIRDATVTGVQTCALPIFGHPLAQVLELSVRGDVQGLHHRLDHAGHALLERGEDARALGVELLDRSLRALAQVGLEPARV